MDRVPESVEHPPSAPRARRFLLVSTGIALALVGAIAAVNFTVDPLARTQPQATSGDAPSDGKVPLLVQRDDLDVLVVGTSRVQRLDPQLVAGDGRRGFNAGIVNAPLVTSESIAAWTIARARRDDRRAPHLVLGLELESLSRQPVAAPDIGLPRIEGADSDRTAWQRLRIALERLAAATQYETLRQSILLLRDEDARPRVAPAAQAPAAALDDVAPAREAADPTLLRADGYLTVGPYVGAPSQLSTRSVGFVDQQHAAFYQRRLASGDEGIDGSARDAIERMVDLANGAGDTPTIVLLPMQPRLARELEGLGRGGLRDEALAMLESIRADRDLRVLDLAGDRVDGLRLADDRFYDGVHPRKSLADEIARLIGQFDSSS